MGLGKSQRSQERKVDDQRRRKANPIHRSRMQKVIDPPKKHMKHYKNVVPRKEKRKEKEY